MFAPTFALLVISTAFTGPAPASAVEVRVPVSERGELDVSELVGRLSEATREPVERPAKTALPAVGVAGGLTTQWLLRTLGPGVTIIHTAGQWVFRIDPDLLRLEQGAEWAGRLKTLAEKAERQAQRRSLYGFHARDSYRPNDPGHPTVVLIHGLNSTSAVFRHMAPLLEGAGFGVLLYDYRDSQDLGRSAEEFAEDWRAFRESHEDRCPWAVVTHSMGGLLARSYVEGDGYQGDVTDLVMVAPPNQGAAVAKMQALLQFLRGVNAIDTGRASALSAIEDGIGESADDLVPGSPFLKDLNAHGRRAGVDYHILAGDAGFLSRAQRKAVRARIGTATKAGGFLGQVTRMALGDLGPPLDELTDGSGDGCVTVESARLEGVEDFEVVHANHVELVRGPFLFAEPGPVACMPFVLDRLGHLLPSKR